MAGHINKRQQVRNERALQELIKTVPGNDRCAECSARNPGWASWSLGIFLCIRCAALHRKLGTHISKVKSLSMDSWTSEQVENMKRIGNATSNKLYNPRNTRAQMPIDADEVDGAMERFIRQKYEHRTFQTGNDSSSPGSRHNTGSTSSDDRPPALPPKPYKRFFFSSLRSASAQAPRQGTLSPPTSPGFDAFGSSEPSPPPKDKKPAKFLGAEVGNSRDDGFERKIQYLKDMGFSDERKNAQVLRGLDGNVDRAVETLIRLGEGAAGVVNEARNALPTPRATPVNGITVEKTRTPPVTSRSNNPFDFLDTNKSLPPPPQSPSDRSLSPPQAYNPFAQPAQQFPQAQQPSIDQAFNNLQISQQPPQQTPQLFPNSTGGYGNPNQAAYNPFLQQTAAPPVPQIPQQYSQFTAPTPFNPPQQQSYSYPQPQPQLQPQPTAAAPNPFLRTSRSQNFNPNNTFDTQGPFDAYSTNTNTYNTNSMFNTQPQQAAPQPQIQPQNNNYNPFQASNPPAQSVFGPSSPTHQSPFGQNGNIQQSPFDAPNGNMQQSYFSEHSQMQYQTPQAPFAQQSFQSPASAPPQQQSMYHPPAASPNSEPLQQQSMFPRHDKSSILALYNMPQLAPAQAQQFYQPGDPVAQDFAHQATNSQAPLQRSVTMPVGNMSAGPGAPPANNPFASLAPMAKPNPLAHSSAFAARGISRESVDFAGLALMNGRHSPDAFSGLSARLR